jgi:hypothetical protein
MHGQKNIKILLQIYYRKYGAEDLALSLASCLWAYQISLKSEEFSFENCPFFDCPYVDLVWYDLKSKAVP